MYNKIVDIIIILIIIGNFTVAIIYDSYIEKLDDETKTTIGLLMVGSWALMGGLAFSAEMSK